MLLLLGTTSRTAETWKLNKYCSIYLKLRYFWDTNRQIQHIIKFINVSRSNSAGIPPSPHPVSTWFMTNSHQTSRQVIYIHTLLILYCSVSFMAAKYWKSSHLCICNFSKWHCPYKIKNQKAVDIFCCSIRQSMKVLLERGLGRSQPIHLLSWSTSK